MTPALSIQLPAGRYHATPWNANVNEAAVEWPPSGWRILRMLLATYHRKIDHDIFPYQDVEKLIGTLAQAPPHYHLPQATQTHSRHYMPWTEGAEEKKTLIFDGFLSIDRNQPVIVAWPGADLDRKSRELLKALAPLIGYLGRAESWAVVSFVEDYAGPCNCVPVEAADFVQASGNEKDPGTVVQVILPVTPGEYDVIRQRWSGSLFAGDKLNARQKAKKDAVLSTLPALFHEAVGLETGTMRAAGWRMPPVARMVPYRLPPRALKASPAKPASRRETQVVTTVRLSLSGKPLPRVEASLEIGEAARGAVMSRCREVFGAHAIPDVLSGHGPGEADPSHPYASYIPEDADGDGHIDHLLIHVPAGIDDQCLMALGRIDRLFLYGHGRWSVRMDSWGVSSRFSTSSPLCGTGLRWISTTPYLRPWYAKRKFGTLEQMNRDAEGRGLPRIVKVERLSEIGVRGQPRREHHFATTRSASIVKRPDPIGGLYVIEFEHPVSGPLTLGYGSHFGLGVFRPLLHGEMPVLKTAA